MIRFALLLLMSLAVSSQAVAAVKWNNPESKNKTQKEPKYQIQKFIKLDQTIGSKSKNYAQKQ